MSRGGFRVVSCRLALGSSMGSLFPYSPSDMCFLFYRRRPYITTHHLKFFPMPPPPDLLEAYFETLGLDIRDDWSFFKLLDQDGDGIVETWHTSF